MYAQFREPLLLPPRRGRSKQADSWLGLRKTVLGGKTEPAGGCDGDGGTARGRPLWFYILDFRLGFFGFRTLPALTLVPPVGFATICFFPSSLHIKGFILSERDGQEGVSLTPMGRDLRKKALMAIYL
jgi:hypothetical protein